MPAVEVGVTIYSTVPAVLLLGLMSVCAILLPEPEVAPVTPPPTLPIAHVKVAGAEAVSAIFVAVLLQIAKELAVVTAGVGFTVTVMIFAGPWHPPAIDVGTTMYSTVPAVELLGFCSVCAIVFPLPAEAPVIPPVMAPIFQEKVLAVDAVSVIFVVVLSQIASVAAVVTTGVGCTVTVAIKLCVVPTQPFNDVGTTRYSTEPDVTALGLFNT